MCILDHLARSEYTCLCSSQHWSSLLNYFLEYIILCKMTFNTHYFMHCVAIFFTIVIFTNVRPCSF